MKDFELPSAAAALFVVYLLAYVPSAESVQRTPPPSSQRPQNSDSTSFTPCMLVNVATGAQTIQNTCPTGSVCSPAVGILVSSDPSVIQYYCFAQPVIPLLDNSNQNMPTSNEPCMTVYPQTGEQISGVDCPAFTTCSVVGSSQPYPNGPVYYYCSAAIVPVQPQGEQQPRTVCQIVNVATGAIILSSDCPSPSTCNTNINNAPTRNGRATYFCSVQSTAALPGSGNGNGQS